MNHYVIGIQEYKEETAMEWKKISINSIPAVL